MHCGSFAHSFAIYFCITVAFIVAIVFAFSEPFTFAIFKHGFIIDAAAGSYRDSARA